MSATGYNGFDGDTALGTVTAVRWWNLLRPLGPDPPVLKGRMEPWEPGDQKAACRVDPGHDDRVPVAECGCGFWAYWEPEILPGSAGGGRLPVLGVVEGWGKTLIGPKGCRLSNARIVALVLMFTAVAPKEATTPRREPTRPLTRGPEGRRAFDALVGQPHLSDLGNGGLWEPDEETQAAVTSRLRREYRVPVYPNVQLMLAQHPPTTDYAAHPESCRCESCIGKVMAAYQRFGDQLRGMIEAQQLTTDQVITAIAAFAAALPVTPLSAPPSPWVSSGCLLGIPGCQCGTIGKHG